MATAKPAADKPAEEPKKDETSLVTVFKDGEKLDVHPTCVKAHVAAGWKPVPPKD